ncbi:homocysteine S-methyltransferase family protein [Allokutzneria sp. A3M-2-11 16]|uniref:homocysteine S-methyltransferase family protein n=1 Tax=Allokutzneria sp. A3M-2-11 16 TaxID=2962043 RepID=UPI0020B6CF5D|nr:homocysteine S-methyltransferase family protein [Allokutzneria sp. A3M-2-11 16]MCP3802623.1 homocysteine S-methyltransferase family protein [Allokutzneria sp. A3M-2-11 16]
MASPLLRDRILLTDSGLETDLIFNEGVDLPDFAAFPLLAHAEGRQRLRAYFLRHIAVARRAGTGFVLEAPTWRANPDWAARLGYDEAALATANRNAVELLADLCEAFEGTEMLISGCVGPRGDGYRPDAVMTAEQAQSYHQPQVDTFAEAGVDMITAMTMTTVAEGLGIARAAARAGLPPVVSFTVETDGNLPDGTALAEAIAAVDADTPPAYFMINCAHPDHFAGQLNGEWTARVRGVRANASRRSHAELDEATELDAGDPAELADDYARLRELLPNLSVLGGCCGTDVRHVSAIAETL